MAVLTCNVVMFIMTSAALVVAVSNRSTPTQVNNCNNFDELLIHFHSRTLVQQDKKMKMLKYTTFPVCSILW